MTSPATTLPREPSVQALPGPLLRAFVATRPAFLTITLVGVVLGLACAWREVHVFHFATAAVTMIFALAAHAGANVVNDFHDRDTDAVNTERLFPFTGGSRFIQNGVLSPRAVALLGYGLLASVIPAGLWLMSQVGSGLMGVGLLGLLLGWAYSAPPLRLAARGLGEVAIASGWALIVIGSDFVQRGSFAAGPVWAGLAFGLMVANLLYINQFPDATADGIAGKRTVVVRLGREQAVKGYALILLLAALATVGGVIAGPFPCWAFVSLLSAIPALKAYEVLRQNAGQPAALRPAIQATIAASHLFGLLLAAALFFA